MNDREIMENILMTTKGACDMYMHGTIESSTPQARQAFDSALDDSLCMQDDIYQKMSQKGWYQTQQAQQQQIDQVRSKFSGR